MVDILEPQNIVLSDVAVTPVGLSGDIKSMGRAVLKGVNFDLDKDIITASSAKALTNIATYMKANPNSKYFVVGHTDTQGKFDYNMDLSNRRAAAVKASLARDHGIAAERLEARGVGPLSPTTTNGNEAGRAEKRRVELVLR